MGGVSRCVHVSGACVAGMNGREDDVDSGAFKNWGEFMIQLESQSAWERWAGAGGGGVVYRSKLYIMIDQICDFQL